MHRRKNKLIPKGPPELRSIDTSPSHGESETPKAQCRARRPTEKESTGNLRVPDLEKNHFWPGTVKNPPRNSVTIKSW